MSKKLKSITNDDYVNMIELLKQALIFYANTNNYSVNRKISDEIFSAIQMDCGTQARFALEKAKVFFDNREKNENYYIRLNNLAENLSEEEQLLIINEGHNIKE